MPEMPRGWTKIRLGEVADIRIGGTPARARPEYWATNRSAGHKWLAISDLKTRRISTTAERITDEGVRRSNAKLLPAGTPVMSFKLSIGRTGTLTEPMYTNEAIAGFILKGGHDASFLRHSLEHYDFSESSDRAVKGVTLNKEKLANLVLVWPGPAEQRAIAATLDAIDEAIEKTEDVIAATEKLRKALLQELLTRGVPGWHTEWKTVPGIGTIPACWEVVKLGQVAEVQTGIALGVDRRANGTAVPYLTVAHVGTDRVSVGAELRYMHLRDSELQTRLLAAGDAVLVEGHAQISQLGRAAIVPRAADGFAYQNHLFRIRSFSGRVTNEFVVALANSPVGRVYFAQFGGTTSGLNTVSTNNVRRMAFGNPPVTEQRRIVEIVRCVDRRLEQERQVLAHLRAIKRETASALLSGRVRVPTTEVT